MDPLKIALLIIVVINLAWNTYAALDAHKRYKRLAAETKELEKRRLELELELEESDKRLEALRYESENQRNNKEHAS